MRIKVRVHQITWEARDISSFVLRKPDGTQLPKFEAGAHIDVHLDGDLVRQYSLCNDPAEHDRYRIAVLREDGGRGGSVRLHYDVHVGDELLISPPRNNFALSTVASRHLLLAGGIGITPFMSMMARLRATGGKFALHYCTREPERTAFLGALTPDINADRVHLHHDNGDPKCGLNIPALLRDFEPGTHLYFCGPKNFMNAVLDGAKHWPQDSLHWEYFSAPMENSVVASEDVATFQIKLARAGLIFDVPPDQSIVEVLRRNDVDVATSCEAGLCGTCKTRYLEGQPLHKDLVLTESEKSEFVMICCARSRTRVLVLDL